MKELNLNEIQAISGGVGMTADMMLGLGFAGMTVSIPVIVGGAILGVPTLGLGFIGMTVGIIGTAISGAMSIMGIVMAAKNRDQTETTPVTPVA